MSFGKKPPELNFWKTPWPRDDIETPVAPVNSEKSP